MSDKLENYKYFSTSLIFLFLAQATSLLIRMGSRIIIARYSSPDLYGLYSVIWNEMTLVATISLLGLGQQLTIKLPRENLDTKNKSVLTAIIYAFIMGFISLIVSIILFLINTSNSYKYSLLISVFFVVFLIIQFIFIGLKDFLGYFLQTSIQSVSLFITIVIVRNILTVDVLVYAAFGSIGLSLLISFLYSVFRYKIRMKSIFLIKIKLLDFSKKRLSLFLVDVINGLILYLLLKLPQVFVDNSFAGFVNVAFSLVALLIIPPQMIAVALGPKISQEYHKSELDKLHNSLRISFSLIFIIQGILIVIFSYFGEFIIELLYGINYIEGSRIIFIGFLLATIIDSFNYTYALYIRNTDHEKLFAIGKIISLFTFIIPEIIFLLVLNNYIQLAVPAAYLISTLSLLAFYFFYTIKLNEKYTNRDFNSFILWLAFISFNTIIALIIGHYLQNQVYLLLVSIASIIFFIFYLLIIKIIDFKLIFTDIKEIIGFLKNK